LLALALALFFVVLLLSSGGRSAEEEQEEQEREQDGGVYDTEERGRRGGDECMREEVSGDRRREHVKVLGVPLSNDPSIPAGEEEAVRARAAQEQRGGGELRLNGAIVTICSSEPT